MQFEDLNICGLGNFNFKFSNPQIFKLYFCILYFQIFKSSNFQIVFLYFCILYFQILKFSNFQIELYIGRFADYHKFIGERYKKKRKL
jgi:hypothetical protein